MVGKLFGMDKTKVEKGQALGSIWCSAAILMEKKQFFIKSMILCTSTFSQKNVDFQILHCGRLDDLTIPHNLRRSFELVVGKVDTRAPQPL